MAPATSTSSSASTAAATTTAAPPPVAPLTGLPQPDPARQHRVALTVKIDNVDVARPQAGINSADVVFEEMVEGSVTRLIAVFQSQDSNQVGPVRSTRTTDIDVVSALNRPLYAYSGGNTGFVAKLRAAPVTDVGYDTHTSGYFTSGPFPQPHHLYAKTPALYSLAPAGSQAPPVFFRFRAPPDAAPAAGATPATHLDVSFGGSAAGWVWDPPSGTWVRFQNGSPDVDQARKQISAANVILQLIPYTTDGVASGEGIFPPPPIPKGLTVGTGTAKIMTNGTVVNATWSKSASTAVTQWADSAGQPIFLTPGQTWVELAPLGAAFSVR